MSAILANIEFDARTCDRESETYRAQFDPADTAPSMAVVAAVAEVSGKIPTDLAPLQTSIDTDALDQFLGDAGGEKRSVTFSVDAYTVTAHGDGRLVLTRQQGDHALSPEEKQR